MSLKVWLANADPATSVLTVGYECDYFYAIMSDIIYSTNVTISRTSMDVLGYSDGSCNNLSGDTDTASGNLVITAGTDRQNVNGTYGLSTNTTYYTFPTALTINGNLCSYGSVIQIGGTDVTVYFPEQGTAEGCVVYIDDCTGGGGVYDT